MYYKSVVSYIFYQVGMRIAYSTLCFPCVKPFVVSFHGHMQFFFF